MEAALKNIKTKIPLDAIIIGAGISGLAAATVSINLRK
jgi:ribulose 1,5-bisphosphate synthetase/thiazole synthase